MNKKNGKEYEKLVWLSLYLLMVISCLDQFLYVLATIIDTNPMVHCNSIQEARSGGGSQLWHTLVKDASSLLLNVISLRNFFKYIALQSEILCRAYIHHV